MEDLRKKLLDIVEGNNCQKELIDLFWRKKNSKYDTIRDQRTALISEISLSQKNNFIRRFFHALDEVLTPIIEGETYVPESAYMEEDDEEVVRLSDTTSSEALLFIKTVAFCLESHITSLIDLHKEKAERKKEKQDKNSISTSSNDDKIDANSKTDGVNTTAKHSQEQKKGKLISGKNGIIVSIAVLEEVMIVMEKLHDSLFTLQSCGEDGLLVQQKICNICELWWKENLEEKECMVVQLIPLLLAKTLDEHIGTKSDVKRFFYLRHALQVLDFDDDSSTDLKSLLLRTVSSPIYLKMNEGKRFIAHLFQLSSSFPPDLFKAMKAQIPDGKKMLLEAYGEILFRAWKEANNNQNNTSIPTKTNTMDCSNDSDCETDSMEKKDLKMIIEQTALQDLSYSLLHVDSQRMRKSLSIILYPFHQGKKSPEIQQLLHRLYGPILWRSLRAANARVRLQAAHVLGIVFPLPDGLNVQKAMTKATVALINVLKDVDPRVRVAGSMAASSVLITYWDALHSNDIRAILHHIIDEHAKDASSSAVRAGAINAISMLLKEAKESHAVLRGMLPLLGNSIHDKVERVRLATVNFLQTIKTVPNIKYYHVVPVHHLLARLAEDGHTKSFVNPVTSALTKLMQNSYFPQNLSGSEQAQRTLSFLASDPMAASVFYANLYSHISVNSVAKLAAMLLKCLVVAVDNDEHQANVNNGSNRKRRRSGQSNGRGDGLSAQNTSLMADVAETICCLWESIEVDLQHPSQESIREFLQDSFSGTVLADIYYHFEEKASEDSDDADHEVMQDCHRICVALLRCAGRLDPENVQGLVQQINQRLSNSEGSRNLTPHVSLLCMWGKTEDVMQSLAASIVKGFTQDDDDDDSFYIMASSRRSGQRKNKTLDSSMPQLNPEKAMEVTEMILRGHDPSSVAARKEILNSKCPALEAALEKGIHFAERLLGSFSDQCNETLILQACETYGRLALHKYYNDDTTEEDPRDKRLNQQAKILLNFISEQVVPILLQQTASIPFRELDISHISHMTDTSPTSPRRSQTKKRTDRKKTPNRRSATSRRSSIQTDCSSINLSYCSAVSLFDSACIIFSEWLAVGGGFGVEEISSAASKWCHAVTSKNNSKSLLSSFLRLAVQLSGNQNHALWGKILSQPPSKIDGETLLIRKAFALSLTTNARESQDGLLNALIHAANETLQLKTNKTKSSNVNGKISEEKENEDGEEVSEENIWSFDDYILIVLEVIACQRKASIALAKILINGNKGTADDKRFPPPYAKKWASYLLNQNAGTPAAETIKNIISKYDIDTTNTNLKERGDMNDLIHKMIATNV